VQHYCTAMIFTENLKHRHSEGTLRAEESLFLFAFKPGEIPHFVRNDAVLGPST
jgi:hypothetical protein